MLQIGNTIITFDILEEPFACDLSHCKGACCIEGDAGAPITEEERRLLKEIVPVVWDDLTPAAQAVINTRGVAYIDEEGDLVTGIVNGKDCVFTTYGNDGMCHCALEKAFRAGRTDFYKPLSCHLYPIRIKEYNGYISLSYHRWKICRHAQANGRQLGCKVYEFLREPLVRRFGEPWYQELCEAAKAWENQQQK